MTFSVHPQELEADSAIDQARHPRSRGPLATAAAWISLSLTSSLRYISIFQE
jgi:hypothetical protein